jgi:hypothetical protein
MSSGDHRAKVDRYPDISPLFAHAHYPEKVATRQVISSEYPERDIRRIKGILSRYGIAYRVIRRDDEWDVDIDISDVHIDRIDNMIKQQAMITRPDGWVIVTIKKQESGK